MKQEFEKNFIDWLSVFIYNIKPENTSLQEMRDKIISKLDELQKEKRIRNKHKEFLKKINGKEIKITNKIFVRWLYAYMNSADIGDIDLEKLRLKIFEKLEELNGAKK